MKVTDSIQRLALGALIGCFVVFMVWVLIAFASGPQNVTFSGTEIVNGFFGSIVVGLAFSASSYIYEKENISLVFQALLQMAIGFAVLFLVAIYLGWMPINLGIGPIITWIIIAVVFAVAIWGAFYIHYYLEAKSINKKIDLKSR